MLRAAPGRTTGIDLDRIVLGSDRGGAPFVPTGDSTPRATPAVRVLKQGRSWMDVTVDRPGRPFWLVLGQSLNDGWRARADGIGGLGRSKLIDGYANGWLIDSNRTGPLTVHLRWTPRYDFQRVLEQVATGEPIGSPLAHAVGFRGYHHRREQ